MAERFIPFLLDGLFIILSEVCPSAAMAYAEFKSGMGGPVY